MRPLTTEDREQLRARWGADALRVVSAVVDSDEGEETVSLVLRRPSLADYDEAVDASVKPRERFEAWANLATKCAVWPSASEVPSVLEAAPTIVETAWAEIDTMMSGGLKSLDDLKTSSLASLTAMPVEELEAIGLTVEQVAQWKREHKRGCLVMRAPRGLWICKRPGFSAYSSYQRARNVGEIASATRTLVAECGVWPAPDRLAAELEQHPGAAVFAGVKLAGAAEKTRASAGGI